MQVLGVILARAGSKGVSNKCVTPLLSRPLIEYTFDHARAATCLDEIIVTTDSKPALKLARERGLKTVERPRELATDEARVDDAARHAVLALEKGFAERYGIIVLLYGNIPVRSPGVIDRAVARLVATGADSVRTVAPVGKHHPDWLHRLKGPNADLMRSYRENRIYRRQDLEPLYYHDAAVVAVRRAALFGALEYPDDPQAFLGRDRRALVQRPDEAVDVDEPFDLLLAEVILRRNAAPSGELQAAARAGVAVSRAAGFSDPAESSTLILEAGTLNDARVREVRTVGPPLPAMKSSTARAGPAAENHR